MEPQGAGGRHDPPLPLPPQRLPGRVVSLLFTLLFPTSLLGLLLVLLLAAGNGVLFFAGLQAVSSSSSSSPSQRFSSLFKTRESIPRSSIMAAKEEAALPKPQVLQSAVNLSRAEGVSGAPSTPNPDRPAAPRRVWSVKRARALRRALQPTRRSRQFASRARNFLRGSAAGSNSSVPAAPPCEARFFMTWISPLELFGARERFAVESLFKSHPGACLLVLSSTMDTAGGEALLAPFRRRGFRAAAMSPGYAYLFKNTPAELWYERVQRCAVDPGGIPPGQNLSNLLRLAALYRYGGAYIDTDVIVMKSFSPLRNVIGAQAVDPRGNWSRLNNAVLVFDARHPLLYLFIQEFALTFDGNKWGHNGPYLVSRVVERVAAGGPAGGPRFTVLPPSAFYPVDWIKIADLFRAPRPETDLSAFSGRLSRIRERSFAVHLWNSRSKKIQLEEGSIVARLVSDCCVLCNASTSPSPSS